MLPIFDTRRRRWPDYDARTLTRKQVKQAMGGVRRPNEGTVQPFPVRSPVHCDSERAWCENLNAGIIAEVE
jgi:hypothetical protein